MPEVYRQGNGLLLLIWKQEIHGYESQDVMGFLMDFGNVAMEIRFIEQVP